MDQWENKRVTVLGLGRSGLAAARYLHGLGASVFVSDAASEDDVNPISLRELVDLKVEFEFGGHTDRAFDQAELFVVSPGIPPRAEVIKRAQSTGRDVVSDIELAYRETSTPIIAVTGTNGKSTTTTLISYMLEKSGMAAPACGNIGVPILSLLGSRLRYLVAEVSSFQLQYSPTFAPRIGVWLNLTPDHLDWHKDFDEYVEAKRRMFVNQFIDQYAVLNVDDSLVITTKAQSEVFPFSTQEELEDRVQAAYVSNSFLCVRRNMLDHVLCHVSELGLRGNHNLENALAASAAAILAGADPSAIEEALKSFKGLEHRLELVGTVNGIDIYNDSKATNTVSAIKALTSFPKEKVVLIAGGKDKGTSLEEFAHVARNTTSAVILIGEAADRFEQEMTAAGVRNIHRVATMEAAVQLGLNLKLGPVVLSPACSSFDMFKDYEERGRVFKDIVRKRLDKVAPSS